MWYLILVFLAGLILFHGLEHFLPPVMPDYKTGPRRRGYLADFTASLVNGPVLSECTKIGAIWLVLWFPRLEIPGMAPWPWALQFVVFLLVNDFARYWLHRWYHVSPLLWRAHRVHHTLVEMDALSTFRVHVLEALIKYGVIVLPFHLLHVDRSIILLYGAVDILKGFWHHANWRTHIGPLNYFFNSAELHWWHHSTEARGQRANYGSIFSIWDVIFGTLYYDKGHWPEAIGVDGMENFPHTYHELLASVRYGDDQAIEAYSKPEKAIPCVQAEGKHTRPGHIEENQHAESQATGP
ncbi:MAG: sterol desaturase family protein [Phycisphaerae bacterium]